MWEGVCGTLFCKIGKDPLSPEPDARSKPLAIHGLTTPEPKPAQVAAVSMGRRNVLIQCIRRRSKS
jgi:hypothetical protein